MGWDAGNGAAGEVIERLVPPDCPAGTPCCTRASMERFPIIIPIPLSMPTLPIWRHAVARGRLDFGLAFDGDGDRLGVIDSTGRALAGDQLLMLFAEDVLKRQAGATVIADIKASSALFERIAELGGTPLMWKTGHSHIKSKMKATGALLGGEMTGHVFFADDYYGFDDALYAAVRLMAATARLGRSVTQLRDAMPAMINTPELRFPVEETAQVCGDRGSGCAAGGSRWRGGRDHRRAARDDAGGLVAAARLEHRGHACRPCGEQQRGRAGSPAGGAGWAARGFRRGALRLWLEA